IGPCFSSSNDKYMGEGNDVLKGPILKYGSKIGNNASLLPGITIGKKAVVGAGSVVTKDVLDHHVVVGNPAKQLSIVYDGMLSLPVVEKYEGNEMCFYIIVVA